MSCCRSWVWIHQAPTPLTWVVQYKETLYMDLLSETVILCISVLPGFLKPISECSVLTPIWNYFLVVLSVVFHLTGFVQHQKWSFFFFYQSKHLISNQNWKKKSVEMIVQTLNKKKKEKGKLISSPRWGREAVTVTWHSLIKDVFTLLTTEVVT